MEIVIYREPCWLLEAAELVYSLVNEIPADKLTAPGPYCIPAEEVAKIQAVSCAGLSPKDPLLQYYFKGAPLEGYSNRDSCLACCLLYSSLQLSHPAVDDMAEALSASWHRMRQDNYRVDGIDVFSLSLSPAESDCFQPLSQELAELPVPQNYRMKLLETFLDFDGSLAKVVDLLRPVAEALPALLEPWVRRAGALIEAWEHFFRTSSLQEFALRRVRLKCEDCRVLEMALRYFFPQASPGKFWDVERVLQFHMSVAVPPDGKRSPRFVPEEWEFTALRLLANPARTEMLRSMAKQPKTALELSKELELNQGSVFRDLNNLYNARLLLSESTEGKNYYRTNVQMLHDITNRLVQYIEQRDPN